MRHVYGQFRSADGVVTEKHDGIIIYVEEKIVATDGDSGDCLGGYFTKGFHGSPLFSSFNGDIIYVGCMLDTIGGESA